MIGAARAGLLLPARGGLPTANLVANWDAAKGITISTGVSAWADQTGHGHTLSQSSGTRQPQYVPNDGRGYPCLLFDGSNDFLRTAQFTIAQPFTQYFVLNQVTWTSVDTIADGYSVDTAIVMQYGASPSIKTYASKYIGGYNTNLPVNTPGVLCNVFHGVSSSTLVGQAGIILGDVGVKNSDGLTLGAPGTGYDSRYANIKVYEVAIYSEAHSLSKQQEIIQYLSSKWGIAYGGGQSLPARYWKMLGVDANHAGDYQLSVFEIQMFASADLSGSDLTTGKTATGTRAYSGLESTYGAAKAIDDNASTRYTSDASQPAWWSVDLVDAANVQSLSISAEYSGSKAYLPKQFLLLYSNDNVNWSQKSLLTSSNSASNSWTNL